MYINRTISNAITDQFEKPNRKIIILYGARQIGKTTLIRHLLNKQPYKTLSLSGDQLKYVEVLSSRDWDKIKLLTAGYEIIFIDEAQRIPDIAINLKILAENQPESLIICTGSSSFDLANKLKEPLTGRSSTHILYPISWNELLETSNAFDLDNRIPDFLRFGQYPEIFSFPTEQEKINHLDEICSAYLYKDILELSTIKHPNQLRKLLQLLAFQIGSEVSVNELSKSLGISRDTVNNYLDLLEKTFVIFRLSAFSRNLRKEISKMDKIYFYDLGIRNSLISNFNDIELRNDLGSLWENFLVMERLKTIAYRNEKRNCYFWRTYTGAELDYVEEWNGRLYGYEFKWKSSKKRKPSSWLDTYPESSFMQISRENYYDFLK